MEIQLKKSSLRLSASSFLALTLALAATPSLSQALDPIITFDQTHPLLHESHDIPMVQVFADGTVSVNRRLGKTNPGQYDLKLNENELRELMTLAQTAGIVNFSSDTITNETTSNNELTMVSDSTTTIMQFNRVQDSTLLSAGDGTGPTIMQTIELEDVVVHADANLDSPALQAVKRLHLIMVELFSKAGA